jgi:hypothetical protein
MKLYTEEQVRKAIELAKYCEYDCGGVYFDFNLDSILPKLTPIELPSDEEIEESSPFRLGSGNYNASFSHRWQQGAKWMRDKIQGGIK